MPPLPKRRCETCKHFTPTEDPLEGMCSHVGVAQGKPQIKVHATYASCAGQWHGKPDLWEPKKFGWWPFGK